MRTALCAAALMLVIAACGNERGDPAIHEQIRASEDCGWLVSQLNFYNERADQFPAGSNGRRDANSYGTTVVNRMSDLGC